MLTHGIIMSYGTNNVICHTTRPDTWTTKKFIKRLEKTKKNEKKN